MFFNNRLRTAQSDPLWRGSRVRGRGVDINLAEDTEPGALGWNDPTAGTSPLTNWQRVTGTSIAITLRATHTNAGVAVVYYVNSSATTVGATTGSVATSGTNIVVPIGYYVAFGGTAAAPPQSTTITVRNQNTGKVQDTVTLSVTSGTGSDVSISPNPVWSGGLLPGDTNWQQITGIDTQVTLSTTCTGLSGYDTVTVYRNTTATKTGATSSTLSPISTSTFTVNPNEYVLFTITFTLSIGSMTVKNVSDANVQIAQFTWDNT